MDLNVFTSETVIPQGMDWAILERELSRPLREFSDKNRKLFYFETK
jgi:hypothetical protein